MHIESFLDVINACRFCFMCRHLDTTANVTFREADIPRGRALILDRVRMNPEQLSNSDYINTMYDCALSAACRQHCVSSYDEAGLVLAARSDIVEAGLTPCDVKTLADSLVAEFATEMTGNAGDILYIETTAYQAGQPEIAAAFGKAMAAAGVAFRTLRVNDTGKALAVLGFADQAAEAARQTWDAITASGCSTVVASCPATFDAIKGDSTGLGAALDGLNIQHTSTYLLGLVTSGQLTAKANRAEAIYIDSDFLRNYNGITDEPRELLGACGYALKPFGTNPEESYACGEGAVVFARLRPRLVELMRERFVELMDSPDDLIITASPYTRHVLSQSDGKPVRVISIEEAVANRL